MLFNSFVFFVFLGIILPIFYMLPSKRMKNLFLLASSYIFYGYWDWRFCGLLAFSTIIDFYLGKKIHQSEDETFRKRLLQVSLFSNLGVLAIFKYFNFFIETFEGAAASLGYHLDYLHLNILLPVGISFYTFQTLSYTIDIYRRRLDASRNFIDFALFVAFFPQLVAGPIERAKALLPQLAVKLKPTKDQVQQGIVLIVTGLFRKVIIGDTSGRIVDRVFGDVGMHTSDELLFALLLFSVQIYADFSGYSHIARGTAKLLGVELMKNFEQPYLSRNITEFWRRWHISLSSWLKDYLYISLGGNRGGINKTYRNLFITMLLGGLWHGASWNFVIWGGLHGIYLAIHKYFLADRQVKAANDSNFNFVSLLKITFTFSIVIFTWLFFRSTSWDLTVLYLEKILFWQRGENFGLFLVITLSFLILMLILDLFEYISGRHTYLLKIQSVGLKVGILASMFVITCIYLFQAEPAPFIYFQF